MDRLETILRFQWRAYWRRIRGAGHLGRNNVGLLVLVVGYGTFKYLQQLPLVATQLQSGRTSRYETLLLILLLLWMFPVMSESRRSITTSKLLHLPLTTFELYCLRVSSVFISPVSWILGLGSLALSYVLLRAQSPVSGIVALLLFLVLGIATSLIVTHLLSNAATRRILVSAVITIFVATVVYWTVKGSVPVQLRQFTRWLPNTLVSSAAVSSQPGRSVALLLVLTVAVVVLSLVIFRLGLQAEEELRSPRFPILGLIKIPGRFGGLLKKDLRYSSRLLDVYLAVPITVVFNIYLISNPSPSPAVFWTVVSFLLVPCVSLAFNGFGLDNPLGLDRYSLMPLSGRDLLLSKNLSFAFVGMILFSLIVPLAILKLGAGATLVGFLILVIVGLAYLTWGNWMSVSEPFRMQFYRFASGGSPIDALVGLFFGSLPGILAVFLLNFENYRAVGKIVLMMAFYFLLYLLSVRWSARKLEARRELVRLRLS